ncbi:hypothetical protein OG530_19115 [Streptomyces decoyicus]|uniref:hypothetical protein n=1 Tax=Streptomyces decoyicus TaxID=249567 RepID=UPI002E19D9A3
MAGQDENTPPLRFVPSARLPDGEVLVPLETPTGLVLAYREEEMTDALLARLNATLDHMTACGLLEWKG